MARTINPKLNLNLNLSFGRRGGGSVVGLDIQPGYVTAVQAHVNGGITVERAIGAPLAADSVREGEVLDEGVLSETLRELFRDGGLGKRVRIGVANQRTVLRTLELPPVTDRKELAAAVRFQAEDQVPMPLGNAVLDFQSLGLIETPAGPRQRVIVVAAQRDMVERLVSAVREAGLRPEGVDLSAFALIRSLYRSDADHEGRVLYLNVGGLTNMAIAEGTICRFTRVVGGGLEAMAGEIAERRGIALVEARELLAAMDLTVPAEPLVQELPAEPVDEVELDPSSEADLDEEVSWVSDEPEPADEPTLEQSAAPAPARVSDSDIRAVLENGIREIVGDVRNSLDFHRSQDGGGEVTSIVLSGPALEIAGFSHALEADLGIEVHRESVHMADDAVLGELSPNYLAIAAGLAAEEVQP
jgi:type IV pilus assembly protein PilM